MTHPKPLSCTESRDGAVAILTLTIPRGATRCRCRCVRRWSQRWTASEPDRGIRAMVVTGAGGNFCAGGDISSMGHKRLAAGRERFRTVAPPGPHVRAVDASRSSPRSRAGPPARALAGVLLRHHRRRRGRALRVQLQQGRTDGGPRPAAPAARPHRPGAAKQISCTARQFDAGDAARVGLVDHVAAPGRALEVALERARPLAEWRRCRWR